MLRNLPPPSPSLSSTLNLEKAMNAKEPTPVTLPESKPEDTAHEELVDGDEDEGEDDEPGADDALANGSSIFRCVRLLLETPNSLLSIYTPCYIGDKKKKKKKKPKKKKAVAAPAAQSEPPRVGLSKIFINGVYPIGEIQEYKDEYVLLFHMDA